MEQSRFFRFGKFVYRFRIAIIILWTIAVLSCLPFIKDVTTPFQTTGFVAKNSESDIADTFLNDNLKGIHNRLLVLYHSETLLATDKDYKQKIKFSLANLKDYPIKHDIFYPSQNTSQISKNKHAAYAVIMFYLNKPLSKDNLNEIKSLIRKPKNMSMQLGGESIFINNINLQTQRDLSKADLIATPISIITLLIIFGTLVAAMVPMLLGGGCAALILTALYAICHAFTLSIFTLNIALLLGLCLSLDYSLFIISRFRDELCKNNLAKDVIAATMDSAGKAVFFSGLAVFISLSALLFFPINILFSIGVGGLVAVFIAVAMAITLLPAILSILQNKINALPVIKKSINHQMVEEKSAWYHLAITVVKKPIVFFISTLGILFVLSYPVLRIMVGISDYHVLPDHSQNQQFFDTYKREFNEQELTPIEMIVFSPKNSILSKKSISNIYDLTEKLKENPDIKEVNSIVTFDSKLNKKQYQELYQHEIKNTNLKQLLKSTTKEHFTVFTIISRYPPDSKQTISLIAKLRDIKHSPNINIKLTGAPVINADVLTAIAHIAPYACIWIVVLTYLILLLLLRSLFLPLKAIFMNILSLCASYGVLVFIFQEGHLHAWLNFKPQGMIDITLIIIIFCALFGFSMDYEVFLLTRIQEYYKKTFDNDKSIVYGIVKSSRIITSAAIIVIFICASFMVADVLMVKEFGLGIAVAIFVDAFAIRTLLVPATMALVKKLNWYFPHWLQK